MKLQSGEGYTDENGAVLNENYQLHNHINGILSAHHPICCDLSPYNTPDALLTRETPSTLHGSAAICSLWNVGMGFDIHVQPTYVDNCIPVTKQKTKISCNCDIFEKS